MKVAKASRTPAARLLRWYDQGKRDLPWRRQPNAYRTMVSEFMLQQTVVATVIPYFLRFIERFPDVRVLAAADEQDVLALWSGLGYYSRARNLHRAAVAIVRDHGGRLPADEAALSGLPGIGPYTAAAIAAIAFGARTFALDGNAARVVARLFGVEEPINRPEVRLGLRRLGQTLVPAARAGDFAQAVMELGARVCVTGQPRCDSCPVAAECQARTRGQTDVIPARDRRAPKRVVSLVCAVAERDGQVLLVLRPAGTLLGGTWALPSGEADAAGGADARKEVARRVLAELGLKPSGPVRTTGAIRHIFTHRDVTAEVFRVAASGRARGDVQTRWVAPSVVKGLALSTFTRKTLALVCDDGLTDAAPSDIGLARTGASE